MQVKVVSRFKLLGCLLLTSQAVNAQESDLFELSLEDLLSISIASKQAETVFQAPSSVTLITRSEIQSLGIHHLQQLLNYIPGYQSSRDVEQGRTQRISARGRSTALSESILVLVDGQRLNDLYTGGISVLNRKLNLSHVEKVEIIRGPGSALYGSNAFLGVINIITGSNQGEIIYSSGDVTGQKLDGLFGGELNQDFRWNLSYTWFSEDGDHYQITDTFGINGTTSDPIEGNDFYLKLYSEKLKLYARYMDREQTQFLTFGFLDNDKNFESSKQWSVAAQYSNTIADSFEYTLRASQSIDEWNVRAVVIPSNIEIFPNFALENDFVSGPLLKSESSTLSLDTVYKISKQHVFSSGIVFEKAEITDVANVVNHHPVTLDYLGELTYQRGELNFNQTQSRDILGLYLQSQYIFNDYWRLTSGIRYDDYSDFGHSTNPRMALVWNPTEMTSFKLMYGSAFRAPNFLELYDRNNPVDFGNAQLKAEEVKTLELAWLFSSEQWKASVTLFSNKYDDLISLGDSVVSPDNPLLAPTFINIAGLSSEGVESELSLKFSDHFNIKANFSWFTKGSDITTERQFGSIIFNYLSDAHEINFNHYYRGSHSLIEQQEGYWVSNLNYRLQATPNVNIELTVNNLFDKDYRTVSQVYPDGIYNRGQHFSLAASYHF